MSHKIYIPILLLFIVLTGFYASGINEKIKDELKDPDQRQAIMNQMMNNTEYMSEFMNGVLKNKQAQNIMMDQMFMMADNDSTFAAAMFQHMKDYGNMMNHMRDMMNGSNGMMHSYGMMHGMN